MYSRCITLAAAVLVVGLGASQAGAQRRDPGSHAAVETRGFGIMLDANYLSPRGCDQVVGFRYGPPRGRRVHHGAYAYSIIIETRHQGCGRSGPRLVRELRPLTGIVLPADVHLFFVTTQGRVLKDELIAVQP